MNKFKTNLKENLYALLKEDYPLELSDLEINYTPQIKMGDLALAFPFQLAKKLKRSPHEIATEIAPKLTVLEGISQTQVAGGGYINLFLEKKRFFIDKLLSSGQSTLSPQEKKVIVEHTSINPNKAAHIGHLRNSCLGDTLVRCQRYQGENVEVQNYIDDTGVQVADVVFGFLEIEKKNLEEIKMITGKFDYYCWDLYTRVPPYIGTHPESTKLKSDILKRIEEGLDPEAEIALNISRRILLAHLKTMARLDISYDLQACESSIIRLKFWDKAFSLLKEKKATYYVDSGANKGCWVMKLEGPTDQEKILVRSNGIVTYVGKDIAYQLWKFGLLNKDFYYEPLVQEDNKTVWMTTWEKTPDEPEFGKGSLVYNVIDIRQAYPQKIVAQGLKSLHYTSQAEKSIHFSYEMVALSPKSLKELGQEISEEDQEKNFLEVSGRKGLGVKADDLLDRLEQKAMQEVEKRNPDWSDQLKKDTAHNIACGALRYFMLKFARNSVIIFDFEDALNFEGETGPYLQYSLVRINSIFRKLKEVEGFQESNIPHLISTRQISWEALSQVELHDFWELILYASQLDEEVLHSLQSLEFLHLAKFTFNLCQKFNTYYHKYSILSEKNDEVKHLRILVIHYIREILKKALYFMGIPQTERM